MQGSLIRMRPRYSLRLLLVCITVLTAIVAVYREPLRERVEELGEWWAAFCAGEEKPVDRILIAGPIAAAGTPLTLTPPSPDEIVQALKKAGAMNKVPSNLRIVLDPISDYMDPPRVYPMIGPAQLHHSHYKCVIFSDDGEKTVYVDFNRFRAQ